MAAVDEADLSSRFGRRSEKKRPAQPAEPAETRSESARKPTPKAAVKEAPATAAAAATAPATAPATDSGVDVKKYTDPYACTPQGTGRTAAGVSWGVGGESRVGGERIEGQESVVCVCVLYVCVCVCVCVALLWSLTG